MKKAIAIFLTAFAGCISIQPTVQVTKSYEGHFYTAEEAQCAVKDMKLDKNESVWILSNTTLKRVLKNCK